MNATLLLDPAALCLWRDDGHAYDPATRAWAPGSPPSPHARRVPMAEAVQALRGLVRWRVPVGVIGPRDVDAARYALAEELGGRLAALGVPVLCGGRGGVMEAVCKGVERAGGLAIGLLPDADPALANHHAGVVVATGIGEARNALIARASLCLVAIGDSYGTLSEVALGRQFGKRVFGLAGAANVDGVEHVDTAGEAAERVAGVLLDLR
jgi:uncharacterized protein (TIGR00725 family)